MRRDQTLKTIWAMPFVERMSVLTASVVEHDSEAIAAIGGLTSLIVMMSQHFGTAKRLKISDILHAAASQIEREPHSCDKVERLHS